MKGIILAGGRGTRLFPMTKVVSKQLLPIYDKPLIYYPLSVMLLAKISEILIISTPTDINNYKELLGNGDRLGIKIFYKIQEKPKGLADAFIIGKDFIKNDSVCLCLGDNVFYGQDLTDIMKNAIDTINSNGGGCIFGYPVKNPTAFGVVEFNDKGKVISIEEKPIKPKSDYAIPGLYFYDNSVVSKAEKVIPSERGEIEISAINNMYLNEKKLMVKIMGRGIAWLDTGTPEGMLKAAQFVESVQTRQGFYISCIEEIAWRRGFISNEQLKSLGNDLKMTEYGKYLLSLIK